MISHTRCSPKRSSIKESIWVNEKPSTVITGEHIDYSTFAFSLLPPPLILNLR
jgi:hypothetical protein